MTGLSMRRALVMLGLMAVCFGGCPCSGRRSSMPRQAPPPRAQEAAPSKPDASLPEPDASPVPAATHVECHVSCCSEQILAMQAASDDPSIQNECCLCEEF